MLEHRVARLLLGSLVALSLAGVAQAGPVPVPTDEATKPVADGADATPAAAEKRPVVRLTRSINVYTEPAEKHRYFRGTITRRSRVEVLEERRGKGCQGKWLRIADRAWICSRFTRPTDDAPGAKALAGLSDGALLPKDYVVTRDAPVYASLESAVQGGARTAGDGKQTIRGLGGFVKGRTVRKNGQRFVKTPHGWVPAASVQSVEASTFKGVPLRAEHRGQPLGFVRVKRARLYDAQGKRLRERGPTRQTYLGAVGEPLTVGKHTLYAIGDGKHLRARDISIIDWPALPDEVVGTQDKWIDVSVSRQLLVAYQGEAPVMATLVSTARTATTPGTYRIQKKRAYGRLRAKPEYNTQWDVHVPWVMTLDGRLAMHTVYWHEEFGKPFSQGCVNLAPVDAKWVWDFTEPNLPSGWVRVTSDEQSPGTVVRIRK